VNAGRPPKINDEYKAFGRDSVEKSYSRVSHDNSMNKGQKKGNIGGYSSNNSHYSG